MDPREKRVEELLGMNRALMEKIKGEQRRATDEEKQQFDERLAEADDLQSELKRDRDLAKREAEAEKSAGTQAGSQFIAEGEERDERQERREPVPPSKKRAGDALVHGMRVVDYEARAAQVAARLGPPVPLRRDNPWRSFGEFLEAVKRAGQGNVTPDRRLVEPTPEQRAAGLNEAIGSEGGFLVTQDFSDQLLERVYTTGVLSGRCFEVPISGNANGTKIPAISESSRADGSRAGGVQAYWEGEAMEKTASKPAFARVELSLKKLIGLCYATDEMLQDSQQLGAVISRLFASEFGFKTDDSLINGTGAGMPLGILNAACLVTVNKETGQPAATITVENIVKMWARMWARSRPNALWLINQDIEPELFTMGITVGTGGSPIFMPAGGLSGAPYSTLMGRPIVPMEQCQTLGTKGDIILADYSQYVRATKGGIQGATSIHVRFIYDEQTFRFVLRMDGQPWWQSALTPYKGANTLSPFVVLQARS